jgi:H+/Cl- antiporter ClcA
MRFWGCLLASPGLLLLLLLLLLLPLLLQAYLNGIDVPGIFLWKTLVVKLTGAVGAVAGGLAVGKEGPFVHAGACLGALLSQVGGSSRTGSSSSSSGAGTSSSSSNSSSTGSSSNSSSGSSSSSLC